MNLVGKFKVRTIAGHELNWNHETSNRLIPTVNVAVRKENKFKFLLRYVDAAIIPGNDG